MIILKECHLPSQQAKNSKATAFVQYEGSSAWTDSDYLTYNGETGTLQQQMVHENKPMGTKWRNSNYNIHTGKIYGWPTQVLALLASLVCAGLLVTGVIMWLGRKKKATRQIRVPVNEKLEPAMAD